MIHTERDALQWRIKNLYWTLSCTFKELNRGDYDAIPRNELTGEFHRRRIELADYLDRFEQNDVSDVLAAVGKRWQTSPREIRALEKMLNDTLEYLGVQTNLPGVDELIQPRGHLIEADDDWRRIQAEETDEAGWLLTAAGDLEFQGGGWLRNEAGYILDPYGKKIGARGIEGGLDSIVNYGEKLDKRVNRDMLIDEMLDSRLNYRVPEGLDESERAHWYWDLVDNRGKSFALSREKRELLQLFGKRTHQFIWPVEGATVTSAFGARPQIVIGTREVVDRRTGEKRGTENIYSKKHHDGIDIIGSSKIVSVEDGYVFETSYDEVFGNNVFIYHGGGITSRYCHLNSLSVDKYQFVMRNQAVGVMGNTGLGTGIHLHFEIRINYYEYNDPGLVLGIGGASVREGVYTENGTFKNKLES
ncbi:MAG: M23 family metallopeptidase [Spirochaetales bacterium]|nr:M23 family metallopeptidase [Spirochaetales bacterium]